MKLLKNKNRSISCNRNKEMIKRHNEEKRCCKICKMAKKCGQKKPLGKENGGKTNKLGIIST